MSILTAGIAPASRARTPFAWSVLLHCAGALLLLCLISKDVSPTARRTTVTLLAPAPVHKTIVRPAAKIKIYHAPQPRHIPPTPASALIVAPAPILAQTEPEQIKLAVQPPAPPPSNTAVPQPPSPKIQTNVFEAAANRAETRKHSQVQSAGFDLGPVESKQVRLTVAEASGFGAATAPNPGSGPKHSGVSSSAVFAGASASGVVSHRPALMAEASFRSASAMSVSKSGSAQPIAANGSFPTAVSAPAGPAPRDPVAADASSRPVEILHKPRPAYTAEARQLRLEGDVQLEVIFGLDSRVQVLRVLQSLGHGLDDNAIAAANAIRFRPALRQGVPVNTTASVRIRFELAY